MKVYFFKSFISFFRPKITHWCYRGSMKNQILSHGFQRDQRKIKSILMWMIYICSTLFSFTLMRFAFSIILGTFRQFPLKHKNQGFMVHVSIWDSNVHNSYAFYLRNGTAIWPLKFDPSRSRLLFPALQFKSLRFRLLWCCICTTIICWLVFYALCFTLCFFLLFFASVLNDDPIKYIPISNGFLKLFQPFYLDALQVITP